MKRADRDTDKAKPRLVKPNAAGGAEPSAVQLPRKVADQKAVAKKASTSEAMEHNAMPVDRPVGKVKPLRSRIKNWSVEQP
jgi:hypothetical protein